MSEKILIVDDEQEIAQLLQIYLQNDGYTVRACSTGKEALSVLESFLPDLALLDIMLPDMDGFSLCGKIREQYFFSVIMLTARVSDGDKILGLAVGADDYITKPFNPLEVVARVKTQLRRYTRYNQAAPQEEAQRFDIRGLVIDKGTHKCQLYGEKIPLTPLEFSILWYLCQHQGRVVATEELFQAVWGEKYYHSNNTVMTHIGRLREKLHEPPRRPKFIKTVWGVGYEIEK